MGEKNESGNSSGTSRRLIPGVAARIRDRARSTGNSSGGNSGGSGGNSAASGAVIESDSPRNIDSGIADGGETEQRIDEGKSDGIKVTGRNVNRGNPTGAGAASRGNSDTGGSDRGNSAAEIELDSTNVSRVGAPEVFTNATTAIKVPGRRGRKPGSTNKAKVSDDIILPLKIACGFIFDIPVYLGFGKYWELTGEENENLTSALKDVLEAFPSKTTFDFLKAMDKWMPVIVLGITLVGIVKPRYEIMRALSAQAKREQQQNQQTEKTRAEGFVN